MIKTHRYSKEYYQQNKSRILNNQKKYYQKKRIKLKKKFERNLLIELKSGNDEDIKRNLNLINNDLPIDIPLRKLGPKFKHEYIKKNNICFYCNKEFENIRKRKFCSKKCNKEYEKKYQREYHNKKHYEHFKQRMQTDKIFALKIRLRDRLREAVRYYGQTKKFRTGDIINYKEVIEHLGPCPGKRTEWHIDHIKPLCSFNFKDINEIKEAFSYKNLRWISAEENMKKGRKIIT